MEIGYHENFLAELTDDIFFKGVGQFLNFRDIVKLGQVDKALRNKIWGGNGVLKNLINRTVKWGSTEGKLADEMRALINEGENLSTAVTKEEMEKFREWELRKFLMGWAWEIWWFKEGVALKGKNELEKGDIERVEGILDKVLAFSQVGSDCLGIKELEWTEITDEEIASNIQEIVEREREVEGKLKWFPYGAFIKFLMVYKRKRVDEVWQRKYFGKNFVEGINWIKEMHKTDEWFGGKKTDMKKWLQLVCPMGFEMGESWEENIKGVLKIGDTEAIGEVGAKAVLIGLDGDVIVDMLGFCILRYIERVEVVDLKFINHILGVFHSALVWKFSALSGEGIGGTLWAFYCMLLKMRAFTQDEGKYDADEIELLWDILVKKIEGVFLRNQINNLLISGQNYLLSMTIENLLMSMNPRIMERFRASFNGRVM